MPVETRVYLGVEEGTSRVKRGLVCGVVGGLAVGELYNVLSESSGHLSRIAIDVAGLSGGALLGTAIQLVLGEREAKQVAINGPALSR